MNLSNEYQAKMADLKKIIKPFLKPFYTLQDKDKKTPILVGSNNYLLKLALENYLYDIERYIEFASIESFPKTFENIRSRIIAHYHVIEKGLVLQDTRLGYGKEVIETLFKLLDIYLQQNYPSDDPQFISALEVVEAYCDFHNSKNYDVNLVRERLPYYQKYLTRKEKKGGYLTLLKRDVLEDSRGDFEHLAYSRYSIRNFAQENVDCELIMKAIKIAQKSPSVCNRQSSFIYILADKKAKQNALSCQNGNRGFGYLADKILVVTANLRSFYSIDERNQAFIDGGMFGMSLIYALHSLGVGTCTLNWSVPPETDKKLRSFIPIKNEEVVIFMIAVGHLPEKFQVTSSPRKNTEEIVKII